MSHTIVIAILPKDTDHRDAESIIEEMMEQFDEQREVEPYIKPCYCVGREAKDLAEKALEQKMGSWDDARKTFHEKYKDKSLEETDALWQKEIYKPRKAFTDKFLKNHPLKDSPDPKCEECHGKGEVASTYNQDSKWDWYVIGGRWDGVMCGLPAIEDGRGGFNFGDNFHTIERNMCPVSEIKTTPFAVLTPEGKWIERGDMGWFGMVANEKDKDSWEAEFEKIKKAYDGYTAVSLDCHI
jgi:hypothetical protein